MQVCVSFQCEQTIVDMGSFFGFSAKYGAFVEKEKTKRKKLT